MATHCCYWVDSSVHINHITHLAGMRRVKNFRCAGAPRAVRFRPAPCPDSLPCLNASWQVSLAFSVKVLKAVGIAGTADRCNPLTHVSAHPAQEGQVIVAQLCRCYRSAPESSDRANFKDCPPRFRKIRFLPELAGNPHHFYNAYKIRFY